MTCSQPRVGVYVNAEAPPGHLENFMLTFEHGLSVGINKVKTSEISCYDEASCPIFAIP
jgi:hypothetical protein